MSDSKCIQTIRCLAADVVQGAKSGHPGAPMGMAPIAHVLFGKYLNFDSKDADWINRDRFVLSNGHACALLYTMLHLTGYDLPMEKHLAAKYNRPGHTLFDHYTYVFCGDGCLQEGVACEAASLAGHLQLGKMIVVYDDNEITIDGPTSLSYSEDVATKFQSIGWHTVKVTDGNTDLAAMEKALDECRAEKTKPSMILLKTTIGYGSKIQGTAKVHGAPLGDEDIKQLKSKGGLDPEAKYAVAADVYKVYHDRAAKGKALRDAWQKTFASYAKAHPDLHKELSAQLKGELPAGWKDSLPLSKPGESVATRKCSEISLSAIIPLMGNVIGGSADLTGSNLTKTKGNHDITPEDASGRYIRFGVREHGMAGIANGIAAYGGLIPFTATFFNFVTYAWGAVRVGALSQLGVIHVATHDSIGLGEDGPTHQPVEVPALCRATPNLYFFRPCDQTETSGAYAVAIEQRNYQHVIALSRQGVPMLASTSLEGVSKGAYSVLGDTKKAKVILVSSGTEVSLALEAAKELADLDVAVVSMVCTRLFDEQPLAYRQSIFPTGTPVMGIEPYNSVGWERYSHYFLGLSGFGASAPAKKIYEHFGLTKENVVAKARALVAKLGKNAPTLMPLEL
eukprot:TRINITY_DN6907_c0_g1_i2.p1 TRINITY_DN6907_c0_g1~~TRINITY_DN6907_c0_g1_i2.p1  ORF type:complete len:623 (+),score=282.31 TRINITY_DN6907_c0_g1_i2:63-1931(+)